MGEEFWGNKFDPQHHLPCQLENEAMNRSEASMRPCIPSTWPALPAYAASAANPPHLALTRSIEHYLINATQGTTTGSSLGTLCLQHAAGIHIYLQLQPLHPNLRPTNIIQATHKCLLEGI